MPAELDEATSSRAASSTPPRSESPVDSRRVALEWYAVGSADNAASIAGMLLTTECVLCDIKEPEPAAPANPGMGGMY